MKQITRNHLHILLVFEFFLKYNVLLSPVLIIVHMSCVSICHNKTRSPIISDLCSCSFRGTSSRTSHRQQRRYILHAVKVNNIMNNSQQVSENSFKVPIKVVKMCTCHSRNQHLNSKRKILHDRSYDNTFAILVSCPLCFSPDDLPAYSLYNELPCLDPV